MNRIQKGGFLEVLALAVNREGLARTALESSKTVDKKQVREDLESAAHALHNLERGLALFDLGGFNPIPDVRHALHHDALALGDTRLNKDKRALRQLKEAEHAKSAAHHLLVEVPTAVPPSVSGTLSIGSEPNTWIYALNVKGSGVNAYELIGPSNVSLTSVYAPSGLVCSNGTTLNLLFCLGTVPAAFTGIISANSPTLTISAAVSIDNGKTFTTPVPLG